MILIFQEESGKRFGEIAVGMGFLTEIKLEQLLGDQKEHYMYFGEALVKLGVISMQEMTKYLEEFHSI
jgi:hypothetical protein